MVHTRWSIDGLRLDFAGFAGHGGRFYVGFSSRGTCSGRELGCSPKQRVVSVYALECCDYSYSRSGFFETSAIEWCRGKKGGFWKFVRLIRMSARNPEC